MRISYKVRVSKSIILEPQRQTVVTVTTNIFGLMSIQPLQVLYEKHALVTMNGIVDVIPNVPFKILMTNYYNKRHLVPKNHTVAHLLPQPSGVISTTVNNAEVLGLRDHTNSDRNEQ